MIGLKLKYYERIAVVGSALLIILLTSTFLFYRTIINFESTHHPQEPLERIDQEEGCTEEASNTMRSRIQNVRHLCEVFHLGQFQQGEDGGNDLGVKDPPTPQYSYFFMSREKQLAWCPVYKAGSTSWLHNMLLIAGVTEAELEKPPKQLSIWAREIYGEPGPGTDFDSSLKLLIVRHPFSRILSAYLDKLSNVTIGQEHGTAHFYAKYGKEIVKKYRRDEKIRQKEPTFPEFVEYLINTDLVQYSDDHWLPIYYSCTPCRVDYNFIAKVETYNRDQACIIQETKQLNVTRILKPKWKHRTANPSKGQLDPFGSKYFSQLTKFQIRELYQKYKLDFHLFGYSYSSYLEFGQGE